MKLIFQIALGYVLGALIGGLVVQPVITYLYYRFLF